MLLSTSAAGPLGLPPPEERACAMLSLGHTLPGVRRPALLRSGRKMCILAVASGVHPGFPLVVVHNREELAARPTSPCQRWPGNVVCAKDLLSNGTWMGLNEKADVFCSLGD